jgi:hypothetical protein
MSETKARAAKPKLDRAIQERIGRELRAMYDDLLRQPLPPHLLASIDALADEPTSPREEEATRAVAA